MVLSFTALNKQSQFRSFCCHLNKLEAALNVLSTISSQGDIILTAQLIDEGHRMELPVAAFDGQSFSEPIRQLEEQWQAILSQPIPLTSPTSPWRLEIVHQQLRRCNERIEQFGKVVYSLDELRWRAEHSVFPASPNAKLIEYYDRMLNRYHDCLEQAEARQFILQQKLSQLEPC